MKIRRVCRPAGGADRRTPTGRHDRAAPDRGAGHDHLAQAAGVAGRRREDQRGTEERGE